MFREFLVNLRISKLVARIDSRSQEITIVSLVPALYRGSLAASQKSASIVFFRLQNIPTAISSHGVIVKRR